MTSRYGNRSFNLGNHSDRGQETSPHNKYVDNHHHIQYSANESDIRLAEVEKQEHEDKINKLEQKIEILMKEKAEDREKIDKLESELNNDTNDTNPLSKYINNRYDLNEINDNSSQNVLIKSQSMGNDNSTPFNRISNGSYSQDQSYDDEVQSRFSHEAHRKIEENLRERITELKKELNEQKLETQKVTAERDLLQTQLIQLKVDWANSELERAQSSMSPEKADYDE